MPTKLDMYLPHVKVTFDIVTHESAEHGDFAETGWIDESGSSCLPDSWDIADGLTVVDLAVKLLKDNGAIYPSSSRNVSGTWFSDGGDTDYQSGDVETRSYHLYGFTDLELERVYDAMQAGY